MYTRNQIKYGVTQEPVRFNIIKRDSSPKKENDVINYSCCSKPIWSSFKFRTQIKISFMKSESFLTMHGQKRNRNVQGPERE